MQSSAVHADRGELPPAIGSLWDTLTDPKKPAAVRLEAGLARVADSIEMEYSFVTSIDERNGSYEVISNGTVPDGFNPSDTIPLEETYCRRTIQQPGGRMAVTDAVDQGWEDDPAYISFGFDSYVGMVVRAGDRMVGTLCFGHESPREEPFGPDEFTLLELLQRWTVSQVGNGPLRLLELRSQLETASSLESVLDSVLQTLQSNERRRIIESLQGVDDITHEQLLDDMGGSKALHTATVHQHLPKLADAGIIEWDRSTGTIDRGPKFPAACVVLDAIRASWLES